MKKTEELRTHATIGDKAASKGVTPDVEKIRTLWKEAVAACYDERWPKPPF